MVVFDGVHLLLRCARPRHPRLQRGNKVPQCASGEARRLCYAAHSLASPLGCEDVVDGVVA
jgi:hypothetical protein